MGKMEPRIKTVDVGGVTGDASGEVCKIRMVGISEG